MKADVVPISGLPDPVISQMYALLETYFEATTEERFRGDLAEKDYAILLRDPDGVVKGFSTGQIIDASGVRAIYSGDTIIHHENWGEQTLALAFAAQAGRIKAQQPDTPLYWFLITKGYRTYRYLPLFFYEFAPRHDQPTAAPVQLLLDTFAQQKFGAAYNSATGIIHFHQSHGHLRDEWAGVNPRLVHKPDVRFFLQKNPGYRNGDELACLTELSNENIRPIARRAFLETSAPCPQP